MAGSYALSHPVSLAKGILFAFFLAFFHGFTGALCVIALNFIIQQSVSHTLGTVTTVTQIISFGLIFLLGVGIFLKNSAPLILKRFSRQDKSQNNESAKGLLAWAATLGLVPCPAVVMVMLFCLSMDVLILGVLLAVCISLGMAVTISTVMIAVIFGKTGVLQSLLKNHAQIAETVIGLISGAAIAVFGLIFLIAAI